MATDATTELKTTPVYVSYSTLETLLDWIKDMAVTPSRIDRSLWQHKFAGSTGVQLMAGLRFLRLMEADAPTNGLDELARADRDGRKTMLADVLRQTYGGSFVDDLPRMTPKMLDEHLRTLGTTDATHRKAVSFFVNAAKSAGISMPMAIQKRARIRAPEPKKGAAQTKPPKSNGTTVEQHPTPPASKNAGEVRVLTLPSGADLTVALSQPFFSLPADERRWMLELMDRLDSYEAEQSDGSDDDDA